MKMPKRVAINYGCPEPTLKKLDIYAESLGLNRTATITMILNTFFMSQETIDVMKNAMEYSKTETKKGRKK